MKPLSSSINLLDNTESTKSALQSLGIQTSKTQPQPLHKPNTDIPTFSELLKSIETKTPLQCSKMLKGYISLALKMPKLTESLNSGVKDGLFETIYNITSRIMISQSATFIFNFSTVVYVFLKGISDQCNLSQNNSSECIYLKEGLSQNDLIWLVDFHLTILKHFSSLFSENDISYISQLISLFISGVNKEECNEKMFDLVMKENKEVDKIIKVELNRLKVAKMIESLSNPNNFAGQGNIEAEQLDF